MSKEEVLLELVLDNFSNIKEVLNATKDIENFLIKLKLNKKRGGIGVIFEKAKNLVDSLYDHSVKVKNEFYRHYTNLDNIPVEDEHPKENDEDNNTVEGGIPSVQDKEHPKENDSINDEDYNTVEDNTPSIQGKEHSKENNGINDEDYNTVEDNTPVQDKKHPKEVAGINDEDNNIVEDNTPTVQDGLATENFSNIEESASTLQNDPSIEGSTNPNSPTNSVTETGALSSDENVENNDTNSIVNGETNDSYASDLSSTSKSPCNNIVITDNTVLKSPFKERECNDLENDKEPNAETVNLGDDPLEIGEESIVNDASNKNEKGNEKESLQTIDKSCEDIPEIKSEPRIRLVDLSKLIDPRPKKSVKFDSSVIILTSSDEETNTSKKKNDVKDQNGKLKSALKSSPEKKDVHLKENKDKKLECKNSTSITGSESENVISSSDSERETVQLEKKNKSKHANKSKKSDSDIEEVSLEKKSKSKSEKVIRNKHFTKHKAKSSDTENSDEEPTKKKKKTVKDSVSKNKPTSDSSDCIIEEEDNSKNKQNESLDRDSRRSTRLHNIQTKKQSNKEHFRKIFKRKSSRLGKSRFEIVNKKSRDNSDSDSDSDTESGSTNKRKSSQKKKDLKEEHLSDTSSLSDDEKEEVEVKVKSKKKRKRKNDLCTSLEDPKFTYEVYISLPQIECERLKEIYIKNKEILEIKSLTKINLSKRSKRSHRKKNDSKSSSDTEKPKSKKLKNVTRGKENVDEESSDNEPLNELISKNLSKENKEKVDEQQNSLDNGDERMADILMDKMQNSDVDEKKTEESTSESDEEKKKSKLAKDKERKSDVEDEKIEEKEETSKSVVDNQRDENQNSDVEEKKTDETTSNPEVKDKQKKDEKKNTTLGEQEEEENPKSNDSATSEKEEKDDKEKSSDSNSDSDNGKKKWRKDKLLTEKIDSTDSEEEFSKYQKKKSKEEDTRKTKKRVKKILVISDSDESGNDKNKSDSSDSEESKKKSSSSDDEQEEKKKKPQRRRIKRSKNSSSSSDEDKSTRKHIRRLIGKDALSETTKQAEAEEKERKSRIAEKQKKYNQIYETVTESKVGKIVLDYDEKENKELLSVHKGLVKKLKPHQASGVQFMWDACFESLERAKSTKGSGCILAHCMGLGKTLQVITLAHTLLTNSEETKVEKILVVCPVNTVLNWKAEFKKWLPKNSDIEVYELVACKRNYDRQYTIQEWHNDGGVLIIGYTMFRNLSNPDNKRLSRKMRNTFHEGLVDPGPDLIICDEGHLLKNEKTNLSIAMNRIKTFRRIVLTGTPLQNNLKEYWCMVQFIKPNLLGTYKEYLNRFVNPITNGQYTDSTQHDILLMRKRSHVLHKLLDGVVQRRDYGVLEPYLPPKHEFVLFITLTETQVKLYKHYMEKYARQSDGTNKTSFLFTDFQQLQRICTHPRVLLDKSHEKKEKESYSDSEGSLREFINDEDDSASSTSSSSSSKSGSGSEGSDREKKPQQRTRVTRAQAALKRDNNEDSDSELEELTKEWWQEYCDGEELDNINNSGKLFLLFQILKECEEIGDKVLVFSQSLYTLNCIEYFLQKIDEATQEGKTEKVGGHSGSWAIGLDYFRLDGSSSCDNRATWCDNFNNLENTRARLFLISTRAGGLGINLVAANRVIIFDVSWNPSHDIQSIYRVYRFGQTKPCYIYRFVSYGTMEMKIYERQVTKQAISKRVIDEQQIDRHYNQNDLQELYKCDLEPTDRPIPLVPKDVLLGELLQKHEKTIYKYHLHQSLLENKVDEGLNEEERKAAWEEFENEKVLRKNTNTGFMNNFSMNAQGIAMALANIVKRDNPTWSEVQIKGIIPALAQQLQVQLAEGDTTMYTRVQQEMRLMQALQAQKMKEAYYQQQVMRMIQQQQQQAKMLGNLSVDPVQVARNQANILNNYLASGGPSSAPPQQMSSDIIELND